MYHGGRFRSTSHFLPAPLCRVSVSSTCAQPVFQALLFAHCLWHNLVFCEFTFAPYTAQLVCAACLCKRTGSRPPHAARLSSSFDKLSRWRGLFTRPGADQVPPPCVQAQTSPQVCQIILCCRVWSSATCWLLILPFTFHMVGSWPIILDVFCNGRPCNIAKIWCKFSQKYGQNLHADVTALFLTLNLATCVKTFCERRRNLAGWLVWGSVFSVLVTSVWLSHI